MESFFLVCAAAGGTIFVCQFLLTVIGLGGTDTEMVHEIPHDVGAMDHGDLDAGHASDQAGHDSTWFFSMISLRTLVAAVTFFGLAGYAALRGGLSPLESAAIGIVCGGAAMVGVHRVMRMMYGLSQDRTLRTDRAIGQPATVYLTIPGRRTGEGKIQVCLQERMVEYAATTPAEDDLPTGTAVVVRRVIGPGVVEVVPRAEDNGAQSVPGD